VVGSDVLAIAEDADDPVDVEGFAGPGGRRRVGGDGGGLVGEEVESRMAGEWVGDGREGAEVGAGG
jgi:hypothetical protein